MSSGSQQRTVLGRVLHWLKQKLFAGFLALFPMAATIWVARKFLGWVDSIIGKYIVAEYPMAARIPGLGIVALFLLLLVTGTLVRSYIGRKFFNLYDSLLTRMPFARTIYVSVKQLVQTVVPEGQRSFRGVALVQYPRPGMYALVFVTQEGTQEVQAKTKEHVMSVFLPTTPNPTSGYLLLVPKEDLIPLEMSVEDATKFIISAGIVTPEIVASGAPTPAAAGLPPAVQPQGGQ